MAAWSHDAEARIDTSHLCNTYEFQRVEAAGGLERGEERSLNCLSPSPRTRGLLHSPAQQGDQEISEASSSATKSDDNFEIEKKIKIKIKAHSTSSSVPFTRSFNRSRVNMNERDQNIDGRESEKYRLGCGYKAGGFVANQEKESQRTREAYSIAQDSAVHRTFTNVSLLSCRVEWGLLYCKKAIIPVHHYF